MKIWIPQYRWQIIEALVKMKGYNAAQLKPMPKAQLYAIYFRIRGKK